MEDLRTPARLERVLRQFALQFSDPTVFTISDLDQPGRLERTLQQFSQHVAPRPFTFLVDELKTVNQLERVLRRLELVLP